MAFAVSTRWARLGYVRQLPMRVASMPAPKGIRAVPVAVGPTAAVHIYSDAAHIWLQLRRDVPTEESITKPSFKAALSLTAEQAIAVATELLMAAKGKIASTNGAAKAPPASKARPTQPATN